MNGRFFSIEAAVYQGKSTPGFAPAHPAERHAQGHFAVLAKI